MSPLQVGRVLRASQMVRGRPAALVCSASHPLHTTHTCVHTHILAGTSVPAESVLSSPAIEQRAATNTRKSGRVCLDSWSFSLQWLYRVHLHCSSLLGIFYFLLHTPSFLSDVCNYWGNTQIHNTLQVFYSLLETVNSLKARRDRVYLYKILHPYIVGIQ